MPHIMKPTALFIAGVIAGAILAACTSAPVQEMSDARQAVRAAEALDLDPAQEARYEEARQMLRTAERALKEHRFQSAREAALDAHRLAVSVQEGGGDGSGSDGSGRDPGHEPPPE